MTAPAELDLYDVACLAGGPDRVVQTALVALVRAGGIRVHSAGQLAPGEATRAHPVEAAVVDAVGPMGHRAVDTVRWRVLDDERLRDIGVRLHSAGLLGHAGACVAVLRGDRRWLAPTHAGRAALRALGEQPGLGDAEAVRVALGGPARMTDQELRTAVFERPPADPPPSVRRFREVDCGDPELTAYRTRSVAVGATGLGLIDGGRFDRF